MDRRRLLLVPAPSMPVQQLFIAAHPGFPTKIHISRSNGISTTTMDRTMDGSIGSPGG